MKARYTILLGLVIAIAAGIAGLITGVFALIAFSIIGLAVAIGGGIWSGRHLNHRMRRHSKN